MIRAARAAPGRTPSNYSGTTASTYSLGPYASNLTMVVAEVAEQYQKVLWNHGGCSDEIFNRASWKRTLSYLAMDPVV